VDINRPSPPRYLSLIDASRLAGTSEETVRRWCLNLGIGEQLAGAWCVDPDKLQSVIDARRVLGRAAA